ncbi:MAG: MBOAT family protein [Clostridiales bacterium]|nr:MBOAT family protein [Clostridiales bacterium]
MLFSSLIFVSLFFPLFFALYYLLPKRSLKNALLLVFSLFFYAWGRVVYLPLILAASLIGWGGGLAIGRFREKNRNGCAKASLIVSLVLLLGLLGVFKYAGFFVENLNLLAHLELPVPEIVLPIGISFYTFQILSYVADVYRGDVAAQKNLGLVMVYLCAFPQLIAGPVVRYKTVEEELTGREVTRDDVYAGLRRFVTGLGKKVLIANVAAVAADGIFGYEPSSCGTVAAWIGALAYTIQIYFDFSGYSDMAIGMGRMMGFHYLENFNDPYTAVSVTDFWRRWHISMSSFFRDYVYIPLGGNRVSKPRWVFNIAVVWMLTGLWHGAAWTFVLWGVYYGVFLVLERLLWGKKIAGIPVLNRLYTLLIVVIGWVIFRSESLTYAFGMLRAMFGGYGLGSGTVTWGMILERSGVNVLFILAMIAGIVLSTGIGRRLAERREQLPVNRRTVWETAACVLSAIVFVLSVVSIASGSYNPFIYFQF